MVSHLQAVCLVSLAGHLMPLSASLARSLPTGSQASYLLADMPCRGQLLHSDLYTPPAPPPNFTSSKWFSSKLGLCGRRQSPEGFPEEAAESWQEKGVAQAETVGRPSLSNVP